MQRLAYLVTGIRLKGYYIMDAYKPLMVCDCVLCARRMSWKCTQYVEKSQRGLAQIAAFRPTVNKGTRFGKGGC